MVVCFLSKNRVSFNKLNNIYLYITHNSTIILRAFMTYLISNSILLPKFKRLAISSALLMTLGLSACGGGGSDDNAANPSQPIPKNPSKSDFGRYAITGDVAKTVQVGEQIGLLAIERNSQEADTYEWKVISSNANQVRISAEHQPASSFMFMAPGTYTVQFTAKKRNAANKLVPIAQNTYQVTVAEADTAIANLKVDRSARSGGQASLYFDTGSQLSSNDWDIRQISGPNATITKDRDTALAQILLPHTQKDEVLIFEASLKSNPDIKDTAYILLRPINGNAEPYFCESPTSGEYCLSTSPLNHHYAYKASSPVADMLADCVMSYNVNDVGACNLAYLPFIGQVTKSPSIDDIMDRVVVSHDWMGRNFEQFLRQYDDNSDFKRLLRSTTAIVISDNINPSFYWGGTGTMYLSANYLWMTPEERDTLTDSVDFRSGYTRQFDYIFDFDYERDNRSVLYTQEYYPTRDSRASRSLDTIALPLASLLYHELAHANDYVSQAQIRSTDGYNVKQLQALAPYDLIANDITSTKLSRSYPLQSDMLKGLGQVWYAGQNPTPTQLGYTGQQIAEAFFADNANDDYAYSHPAEDVAMLFEEAMMLTRFGINRYTMVMDTTSNTPRVIRGQKNRITEPRLNNRVSFVVSEILPEVQLKVSQALNTARPKELCAGTTYFDYYNLECSSVNRNMPQSMKYRQLVENKRVDEYGRPLGAPRHITPKLPDPRQLP